MTALYKFVSDPDVAQFLLKGVAKFTPIPELNDPSELSPSLVVEAVKTSLARLRREGYTDEDIVHLRQQGCLFQRLAPQFQAVDVPRSPEQANALIRSSFYDSLPRLERLLLATAREMSSKVGLFCLSLRYDSLPMWAHYAANASGIAVEFRDLDKVFRGDETGVLQKPISVRYDREHSGVSFEPKSYETIFFSKFHDWSYEQEVRVVLPLADCRKQSVGDRSIDVNDIPMGCISRLILGWNMLPKKAHSVRKLVDQINPAVEIVQAGFVRGRVSLGPM
jgi:hypothetical protein